MSETKSNRYQHDRYIEIVQGETDRLQNVSAFVPNKVIVCGEGGGGTGNPPRLHWQRAAEIVGKRSTIFLMDVGVFLSPTEENDVEKKILVRNHLTDDRYQECLQARY